jgi:hypothetical protein
MAKFAAIAAHGAMLALIVLWPGTAANAQQAGGAAPPATAMTAPSITFDANQFNVPPANQGLDKLKFGGAADDTSSKPKLPDRVKLGNSVLQIDTNRRDVDSDSRVGVERTDPRVLNQGLPVQKSTPLTSGYIGLKFTTPTH